MWSPEWENTTQYNPEVQWNDGMEVKATSPRDKQQACKPNLHKNSEHVGWEDVTVQQMCANLLRGCNIVLELFDEEDG